MVQHSLKPRIAFAPLLVCLVALSACGFHLRGIVTVPDDFKTLVVTVPDDATLLKQQLLRTLQQDGVTVGDGPYTLVITKESIQHQATVFDAKAQVSEYQIAYELDYFFKTSDGKAQLNGDPIILRRSYQTDPAHVTGRSAEEDLIIDELRQDALAQLSRRMVRLRPENFINTNSAPVTQ